MKKLGKKFKSQEAQIVTRREYVFSESTDTGLKVTLKNTLGLLKYLTEELPEGEKYLYLMTARLNQDALEVRKIVFFMLSVLRKTGIRLIAKAESVIK